MESPSEIIREMLEAWEEHHGENACDCRPEPENKGHVCVWCKARALLAASSAMFGLLFRLKCGEPTPLMELLAMPEIEREEAKMKALWVVAQPDWCGPRQVLFLHRDGVIELWDRELREGWPNSKLTPLEAKQC